MNNIPLSNAGTVRRLSSKNSSEHSSHQYSPKSVTMMSRGAGVSPVEQKQENPFGDAAENQKNPFTGSVAKPSEPETHPRSRRGTSDSLRGFDPLMDDTLRKVWNDGNNAQQEPHPLLSDIRPVRQSGPTSNGSGTPPRPARAQSHRLSSSDAVGASEALSSIKISGAPQPAIGDSKDHRAASTLCTSELRAIAQQLAFDKPRALTKEEAAQQAQQDHVVTLGSKAKQSTGTKKSHQRKNSKGEAVLSLFHHKRVLSSDEVGNLVEEINQVGGGHSVTNTPVGGKAKAQLAPPTAKLSQSPARRSPKLPPGSSPRRNSNRVTPTSPVRTIHARRASNSNAPSGPPPLPQIELSTGPASRNRNAPAKKTSSHKKTSSLGEVIMRTSEAEPSNHQIEVPKCEDFLMHSRLCAVLDSYRVVDQNFDFSCLVGMSRMALNGFFHGAEARNLVASHRPIVKSLLDAGDDIVVEGFFSAEEDGDKMEVAVFNSQKDRQFIVAYRGTSQQQLKPIRNRQLRNCTPTANFCAEQKVTVFPAFRESYFKGQLEGKVFELLNKLSESYPFCDVVMTGHSFGAAMASIAGMRYAVASPMMCVSVHTFGSPKVGGQDWRQLVHSIPNLKVMRVELSANDPFINIPENSPWTHVGHSLVVNVAVGTTPINNPVMAYRFDKHRPTGGASFFKMGQGHHKSKADHDMRVYVHAMEKFAHLGLQWVSAFTGEDVGEGVKGKNAEKRLVV